jgi:hypothetical protein
MTEPGTTDSRWWVVAPGLRLEFSWTGDRWTHALWLGPVARTVCAARAVEADPDPDDPARVVSPAYQEVEFERGVDRMGALLLGQAGPHHFSAVFAVWEGPSEVGIDIDVADRCRYGPATLACTYVMHPPVGILADADPARVAWDTADGRLALEAREPHRLTMAEAGRRAYQIQALAAIDPGSHTQRCAYRWRWTPSTTTTEMADDK